MMLASRIMTELRRTTVSAPPAVLRALEAEAERRNVPLGHVLREAVEGFARDLREAGRRPGSGSRASTEVREVLANWGGRRTAALIVALILDTGPLLAALDAADPDHEHCAGILTSSDEDLVVPALVLAELDYWCSRRLPRDAWLIFLDDVLAGVYRIEPPTTRRSRAVPSGLGCLRRSGAGRGRCQRRRARRTTC